MILLSGYFFYYIAAMIGISIGYHRYFTHRSFTTGPINETIFLIFGLICGGRSALTWAAVHRMHHAKSDTEQDPHSPFFVGKWKVLTSNWNVQKIPRKYVADLLKNPRVKFFHRYGWYLHIVYAVMVFVLGGIVGLAIFVVMPFVLAWLGFGMLNYFAHVNGQPVDLPVLNLIAPGEGWHKYHHDHPRAHRLDKYDIVGWLIETVIDKSKPRS